MPFRVTAHTMTSRKFHAKSDEKKRGIALVGLLPEGETAHMVSLVWTFLCALKTPEGLRMEGQSILALLFNHSVCFTVAPPPPTQSASRVGELRESEDWSPLLLLRRWALEQDSEEGEGLSGSSMVG